LDRYECIPDALQASGWPPHAGSISLLSVAPKFENEITSTGIKYRMPFPELDSMSIIEINPLTDARWDDFVAKHPQGGIFHTGGWLRALHDSYQYQPVVFTTAAPGDPLANGMLFCEVNSWLTGRRLVSLPFSDHCDPLVTSSTEACGLVEHLHTMMAGGKYRYIEFRPSAPASCLTGNRAATCCDSFLLHILPLDLPLGDLFQKLHKDCIQRKVRRAERESLSYVKGRSEQLLEHFYRLLLLTRRRHNLPPQPFQWFRNLSNCLGDRLAVHVAYKSDQAVAAIITLKFNETVTYKYGCSDESSANLGGTPFLFWKIIEESKNSGARWLDLGRSDLDNPGLATFKERLGGERQELNYYRFSAKSSSQDLRTSWMTPLIRRAFSRIPDSVLVASGKLLYRHIG
jgi:GNAT acetyltransferase-like protein